MALCMSVPAVAFTAYADDVTPPSPSPDPPAAVVVIPVNTTVSSSDKNAELTGTWPDYIGQIDVKSGGVLSVTDSDYDASFILSTTTTFKSGTIIKNYNEGTPTGTWIVEAGTYYLKATRSEELPEGETTETVTAMLGTVGNLDLAKYSDRNTLYGFGMPGTYYFKFKPSKTACYNTHAYAVCNSKKKVISVQKTNGNVGLIKGKTYYLKVYYSTANPFVGTPAPYRLPKENAYADTFTKAKKLKSIAVPSSSKKHAGLTTRFLVASGGDSLWVKVKTYKKGSLRIKADDYGMKGTFKARVYNSRGTAVSKYVYANKTKIKKLKRGTYYIKFNRPSSRHTGDAFVILSFGDIKVGG